MVMIGHLINVTRILLSPVVSEDMLVWLNEHLRLFQDLFYQNFSKRINKGHHLLHYEECIRRSGNVKQFNCLPFEQKNKPLKTQASSCRNFKNICKSLAERQTFTMVVDVLDNPLCDKTVHKPGQRMHKSNTIAGDRLEKDMEYVCCPKTVMRNGVEFRRNLLVALKHHENTLFPSYGIILEIIESNGSLFVLLKLCETIWYDDFLQAYEVRVTESDQLISLEDIFQHTTFALWKPFGGTAKYISRRYYNRDY